MKLRYVCPRCKAMLAEEPESYYCYLCQRRFPILLDIPDFRLFPDPYISIEDDHRKGLALAEYYDDLDFRELVARYWEMTPATPRELAQQYVHGALRHYTRSRNAWAMIQSIIRPNERGALLDVGCGTGGFLTAAGPAFARVVGVDIAFRWLVIAKKRLEESGINNVFLICACAEHLPLPDGAFDLLVAEDVLDHTRQPEAFLCEGARVLKGGGVVYLSTPNRYSLAPDPHVWVWGVGFLPPSLRDRYVRWRRGIPYGPIRPVSYITLRRILRSALFRGCRTVWPDLAGLEEQRLSRWQRAQLWLYELVRKTPGLRHVLRLIGPAFHVVCHKVPN